MLVMALLFDRSNGVVLPCTAANLQLEGFSYIKANNYAKALDCFNAALKEHPTSWLIMQSVGCCHMELGHYDNAIAYFQKSIEVGSLHASQCNNMAAVYQRLGQPQKALNWLKLECSIDPAKVNDPAFRAAMARLQDPANNPTGSFNAPDYIASLVSAGPWHKDQMPLKVYVRKNIQIPDFYQEFLAAIRGSLDQWCAATGGVISYKLVSTAEAANIVCDYTDRRELVSSRHELGIDGNTEMLVKQDNSPGPTNLVVLVKDGPNAPAFRNSALVTLCCLHEVGHALGMHGHSPSSHDVMFPCIALSTAKLSERDKKTIRRLYN
jgi:tetratricopeptide (TPR) repeat protein